MDLSISLVESRIIPYLLSMSSKAKFPTSVVFSSYPRGSRSDGERYSKNSPVDPTIVLLLLLLLLPPFVGYLVPFLLLPRTPFGNRRTGPFSFSDTLYRESSSPFPTLTNRPRTNIGEDVAESEAGATLCLSRHCLSEQTAWSCLRAK